MALVAGQIQPQLQGVQDYSGVAQAVGAAQAAPYQLIADLAGQAKDYFKQQGEQKKLIKQSSLQIDAALQLFPDLAPSLGGLKERMKDENIPVADRAAEAEVVANLINMGMGEMRNRADMSYKQQQAMADAIYKQQQLGLQERGVAATEFKTQQAAQKAQLEASKLTEGEISIVDPDTGEQFKERIWKDAFGNSFDYDTKRKILDTERYFRKEPGGLEELPPTSQVGGGSSDLIAQAAEMNIGKPISAKTPGTQGGRLGCADAVCKLVKQATGEEIGTLSTIEMVSKLSKNPKFETVPIEQAQRGDIIVTPRGKRAGHAGVFLDSGAIASNSSAGFKGGSPGTLQQNYTRGTWMNSIDSRNPGKTQVFRYTGGSDVTSQAMGTPEQQAQIASMIEQGAGMQTAQNIPTSAMGTEASRRDAMLAGQVQSLQDAQTQPQPQPQRGKIVRGIPVGRSEDKFRQATPEELKANNAGAGQVNVKTGRFYKTADIQPPEAEKAAPKKTTSDITFEQNAASALSLAKQLADTIEEYGTSESVSPTGSAKLGQLPYQLAIAYAKTVDPSSVAREGEVEAAKKYLIPVGMFTRNETAKAAIKDFTSDIERRILQYEKTTGYKTSIDVKNPQLTTPSEGVNEYNSYFQTRKK